MYGIWETIREFLDRGGPVMVAIGVVIFVMWALIIERFVYLSTENRDRIRRRLRNWEAREDPESWTSRAIYDADVSRLSLRMESSVAVIRALAKLCPLLGLLGTVTGMIVIFDVMAVLGSSSPRAIAGGVAQATLTTMAGMVGALSGIFPAAILARYVRNEEKSLQEHHMTSAQIGPAAISWMPPYARIVFAMVSAFFVASALLFLMQTLIETGKEAIGDYTTVDFVEFIRIKREETIETQAEKPKQLMPEREPETVMQLPDPDLDDGGITIGVSSLPDVDVGGFGFGGKFGQYDISDADYVPIVRVLPLYPRKARSRGLEGYVIVSLTVTTTGTVKNVVIAESSNSVFNRAAIRAAEKFKYRPRMIDGVPVAVHGVQFKLTFVLDQR